MQLYLPIAELSVNMFVIFGMGGAVGFLSGLFGVGGGFLLTPLLIFSGIPRSCGGDGGEPDRRLLVLRRAVLLAPAHDRPQACDAS